MIIDHYKIPESIDRASRIKQLRKLAGITAEELSALTGFTRQTLSNWETAREKGLSADGATSIVRELIKLGVWCDFVWLWLGTGEEPYLLTESVKERRRKAESRYYDYPNDLRENEIKEFERYYEESVIMEIKHNGLSPIFEKGDWVGGRWIPMSPRLVNKVCILDDEDNFEARLVQFNDDSGYNLRFLSYPTKDNKPFELLEQHPRRGAAIIRLWRS
ncbi:HTH_XRE domain containing protein [uncultured Caudovirales phage]|uniref:HTH_XRE domain containing protein n=1 Tax=uncultured Caudovirales phage TaxID=2100421 RepID=A0A6J5L738_9CAUD|nr:HTH_XRE domain containing protein [uncultured Caudovirales phage]